MHVIQAGEIAPDFSLKDQHRQIQQLSDYRGQTVVLLFYPGDFSSVCSEEMSCVMDNLARFNELDARVFGISVDSHHSHRVFAQQLGITYTLLADFHPKGEVAKQYGMYLEERGTSTRGWVVLDREGRVVEARDVGPSYLPDFDEIVAVVERANLEAH